MKYDYYIFRGTHEDLLKLNPEPHISVEEAFQRAFSKYLEDHQEPDGKIKEENPMYALERLKTIWGRTHNSIITSDPVVLIIANNGKYLQSWQTGFTKYYPK